MRAIASKLAARTGVYFLKLSGYYAGYWAPWRREMFNWAQSKGLHILPVHYYTPIPDTAMIEIDQSKARFPIVGEADLAQALSLWEEVVTPVREKFVEISGRTDMSGNRFCFPGAPYAPGDAEFLYGWIRSRKPRRIIEIGSGFTTLLIKEAIADAKKCDHAYYCHFQCIEPYPPEYLSPLPEHISEMIALPLQAVNLDIFQSLEPMDLLFIDSTHVLAYGSDVVYEYLKILPILSPGVIIHIHDIFLPYDYPDYWIKDVRFFWNEQYMLAGMLQGGGRYKPLVPMHQLFREHHARLKKLVPNLDATRPGPASFWLQING